MFTFKDIQARLELLSSEVLGTSDPFYLPDSRYELFKDTVADRYKNL